MKLYKLTDEKGQTRNATQWGEGVAHKKRKKKNPGLCSKDVIHAYSNANLAFLMNPAHAEIPLDKVRLWEAEGGVVATDQLKVGVFALTTVKELPLPSWVGSDRDSQVRCKFARLCADEAKRVAPGSFWAAEAAGCAEAVVEAARAAAKAAEWTAARAARDWTGWTAARAAEEAGYAAEIDFSALADLAVKKGGN